MKYYVIVIANGSMQIVDKDGKSLITEWTDVDKAEGAFDTKCAAYANSNDKVDATVIVVDKNFDIVKGLKRHIQHDKKS